MGEYEDAVREAVAQQLLVPDGADGYAFRHALLREAVYGDLLPGERTRLHGALAGLLADEERAGRQPRHRGRAGPATTWPATTSRVRSRRRCGPGRRPSGSAPPPRRTATSIRRLALWERVSEPEEAGRPMRTGAARPALGGQRRGQRATCPGPCTSCGACAPCWRPGRMPCWPRQAGERLAHFLLQIDQPTRTRWSPKRSQVARAAVDLLPGEPAEPGTGPRHRHLRQCPAGRRGAAPRPSGPSAGGRPPVPRTPGPSRRTALVTLGLLSHRQGRNDEAITLFTAAHAQAREAGVLGVELRAATHLARAHLERGELTAAARVAHQGVRRAEETGLSLAPYGLDVLHLHFQAHFADGEWDHAQQLADGFAVRVATIPEALLSAMALFIDVARGRAVAAERRVWLEPMWQADRFCAVHRPWPAGRTGLVAR